MKKICLFIIVLLCIGCKEDENLFAPLEDLVSQYRVDDAMVLEVSAQKIRLDPSKRREQALLVTWEPLKDIEALYPVKYLFKMDMTANGFTTSIPTKEAGKGQYYMSFTHEELEGMLRKNWKVQGTGEVSISVRVIAQVSSEDKFIKPLYSTRELVVKPFDVESKPLFIYGDAMLSNGMAELSEVLSGELYTWRGSLRKGDFLMAQVLDQEFPAFGKGSGDAVVEIMEDNAAVEKFKIEREGVYSILFDRTNLRIAIQEVPYAQIYFGGSATPTLWTSPVLMNWDVNRPNICTTITNLVAGELKFSTQPNFSSGTLQLRPMKPDASINQDLDVMASMLKDWKWRTTAAESGRYYVELDVQSMKVKFVKIN
ncbi:MAG: SusE domain-containing protein [Sphingobacterium sp.]|nr:SusE domain-containing protein [Sphingobacterium sp.]